MMSQNSCLCVKMVLFRSTLHTLTCELSSLGYVQVNNVDVDVNFAK